MNKINWTISNNLTKYPEAIKIMEENVSEIIKGESLEKVWLLQHPPLYTSGTSANEKDLIAPKKFDVFKTGRGGQYTYHGPGQRVAYVMLDLNKRDAKDVRKYVYNLEQWIINTLNHFGVKGGRKSGRVGIWVDLQNGGESKIAAIGVRVRKWVTFHGIAINVNPDLEHFTGIVPCGISQYGVTSLKDLGCNVDMNQVDEALKVEFNKIFG